MDTREASIVGYTPETTQFTIIGHASNKGPGPNSNENAGNNLEITLVQKYFREISRHLENADEVHVTGTGTIQEQFLRYLGETPLSTSIRENSKSSGMMHVTWNEDGSRVLGVPYGSVEPGQ